MDTEEHTKYCALSFKHKQGKWIQMHPGRVHSWKTFLIVEESKIQDWTNMPAFVVGSPRVEASGHHDGRSARSKYDVGAISECRAPARAYMYIFDMDLCVYIYFGTFECASKYPAA